jgi:beta-lactamase class A
MKKTWILIFVFFWSILLSFFSGIYLSQKSTPEQVNDGDDSSWNSRTYVSGEHNFTNPLLECELNTLWARRNYIPFENDTTKRIEKEIQEKNPGIHLSVYFRNLNNGPWFGINEDEDFSPASLMKLPILIIYLKWSEYLPEIFKKTIKIDSLSVTAQIYKPQQQLEVGKEYPIETALEYLIKYSDNTAVIPLLNVIPVDLQEKILMEIGVPSINSSVEKQYDYVISVKEYASFFRVLYNASYLRDDLSEVALNLLSQTLFDEGIRSSIPKEIKIAHKFGERESEGDDGVVSHQLHDCGIVYYPRYPYLLCVMTKGPAEYSQLSKMIQWTSAIIYEEINTRYWKQDL